MSRCLLFSSLLALVVVAGCSSSPEDALVRENIRLMNEWAAFLESGSTPEKGQDIQMRFADLARRMQGMNPEAKQAALQRHAAEFQQAVYRVIAATKKATQDGTRGVFPGMPIPGP